MWTSTEDMQWMPRKAGGNGSRPTGRWGITQPPGQERGGAEGSEGLAMFPSGRGSVTSQASPGSDLYSFAVLQGMNQARWQKDPVGGGWGGGGGEARWNDGS